MSVRVRFAPSPTGFLHIGGARTALFNWVLARQNRGVFVLRIEDTDLERSSTEMVEGILEGLSWLGLDWDEGPYHQSERGEHYHSISQKLVDEKKAYHCFCPAEMLQEKKRRASEAGQDWQYDRTCRRLSEQEVGKRLGEGLPSVVRFAVPREDRLRFRDLVYGDIEVETNQVEDFVLVRSDGSPTFHLAVVADDSDMRISHVVRGGDHLSNTPKHILLHQALGLPAPQYAHLPLIMGSDKKRLSKRHGATSVLDYRERGFLPEALVNYLARLGWAPSDDEEEILTRERLIELFDLKRINKSNALFDPQKLEWMNAQYLARLTPEELAERVLPFLKGESFCNPSWDSGPGEELIRVLALLQSRAKRLTDFAEMGRPFLQEELEYEPEALAKQFHLQDPGLAETLKEALSELSEAYSGIEPFDPETTETVLRELGKKHGLKSGVWFGAVRVALTGRKAAPGIFDVIVTLGRERTVKRLRAALDLVCVTDS